MYGPEGRKAFEDGAFTAEQMLGQVFGPFWLPCHQGYQKIEGITKDEIITKSDVMPQCAGAAIFRANVGVDEILPQALLHLPKSDEVFGNAADFYTYHKQEDRLSHAQFFTRLDALEMLVQREMTNQQNKNIKKIKP